MHSFALVSTLPLQLAARHSLSGSAPSLIAAQVPSAPAPFFAAVHALQAPVHAVSQQTPSAHSPLTQSALAAQARPFARLATHAPLTQ